MKIRTRFRLTLWASVAILTVGATFTVLGIWQIRGILSDTVRFNGLVRDLSLLKGLTLEYELDSSARIETQWRRQYRKIGEEIAAVSPVGPEVSEAFANLLTIHGRIIRQEPDRAGGQEEVHLRDLLHSQLLASQLTETQRIIDWIEDHAAESRNRLLFAVGFYSTGAVALLAFYASLTGWILVTTGRNIVRSVTVLKGGAEAVSRGDLGQQIELGTQDELAELAAAFNVMARKLRFNAQLEAHLAQAQKLEALGTLAGGIAHDFNNMLGGIIGYIQLAMRKNRDEKVGEWLRDSLQASERAADLVRKILTFSRTTQEEEEQPIEVGLAVKEALKLLQISLPPTITIQSNISTRSVIRATPSEIHRLVMNLCVNAAQAMSGRSGGVLEVALDELFLDAAFLEGHPEMSPGRYARLTVRDNGCGMTPEVKERIFDPFFTTRHEEGGTGMGLSVVHGIVKKLGGAISVASEPGKGSTFAVFMPVSQQEKAAPAAGKEVLLPGTESILFVDDEPLVVDLSREMLSSLGYRVRTFTSSLEALQVFSDDPGAFDLVITDVTMPGMTGDVLAARVRQVRPGLPVILCSGYSDGITAEEARGLGVDAFLRKPVVLERLSAVIRKVLEESKRTARGGAPG